MELVSLSFLKEKKNSFGLRIGSSVHHVECLKLQHKTQSFQYEAQKTSTEAKTMAGKPGRNSILCVNTDPCMSSAE